MDNIYYRYIELRKLRTKNSKAYWSRFEVGYAVWWGDVFTSVMKESPKKPHKVYIIITNKKINIINEYYSGEEGTNHHQFIIHKLFIFAIIGIAGAKPCSQANYCQWLFVSYCVRELLVTSRVTRIFEKE